MSEQTARLVDRLRTRLHTTIRRITLAQVAFGTAVTAGVIAALWLLSTAIEAGFWLAPTPRSVLIGVVAVATLGVGLYFLTRPVLQLVGLASGLTEEDVARRIGSAYPEVSDRLVNVLDLVEGRRTHAPAPLLDEAVRSLSEEVDPVPFEEVEDFERARWASRLASLPIVGLLLFLLAAPDTFWNASQRLLAPRTTFERPAPFSLSVQPGDVNMVKGDSLQITVQATGQELPSAVTLALNHESENVVDQVELTSDSAGVYHHTLVNVRQSLRYRIEASPVQTRWYAASVTARPLVRTLQVTLTPPAYTDLPTRRLDPNVGDISGLPGTRAELNVGLGGPPVNQAHLVFDDGTRDTLSVESGRAMGSFTLRTEGQYQIALQSTEGVSNRAPIRYSIQLREDARPNIVFLAPERTADLTEDLDPQLRLRLSDDFGFAQLRLYYRVAERRFGAADSSFSFIELPLSTSDQLDRQIDYRWQLDQKTNLDLVPGDVVEYFVRVWDNDAVAGYKSAETQTQRLRLPSLAEKYEQVDEQQSEAADQMEELKRDSESIQRQFNELRDELRRKQDADWEDQRQVEQLQNRQKELESSVEELSRKMESITQEMRQNNLASPETLQKYEELQQVIKDINSPELMDALKKLQQSVENFNLEQMQQALEDFEFNEQQYQQRLERSLELFKQIRAQQQLEEAARRAEDLRKQQERLAEATQQRMDESAPSDSAATDAAEASSAQDEATEQDGDQNQGDAPEGEKQTGDEQTSEEQTGDPDAQENTSETGEHPSEPGEPSDSTQTQNDQQNNQPSDQQQSAESPKSNRDLAQEQQRASEEMKELEQEIQKMREQMQEMRSAPNQQMKELSEQLQQQQLPQQMQQNSQQLQQNKMQDALQGQQQMKQQLQQLSQRLQQMRQGMQGQQMQINMAGLQAALENTLTLSDDQEGLRRDVRRLSADSPTLRSYAQEQSELQEGLRTVSDSLQQLAQQIPQMSRAIQRETGNALRQMDDATTALSERKARQASSYQKSSMMHLNELAILLSDLLEQMMNSQGGGGGMSMQQMMQQLQQMSGQQQKLNQQIQQFLNDMQGNRLSVEQQQRLQQMARQQQKIKEELEELGRGTDFRDQVLGDLNRIAEEMEKTIRELQRGEHSQRTIERQQEILTRMLNAQRSLQKQGKEQQRKGRQPEQEFNRPSPGELSREEQIDRLRRDLIRALETGYAPDYEELIKRYFELLQSQQNGNGQ